MKSMTRRNFLKLAGVSGLTLSAAAALAACQNGGSDDTPVNSDPGTSTPSIQAGEKTDSGKETVTVQAADGSEVVTVASDESKRIANLRGTFTSEQSTWCLQNSPHKPGLAVNFIEPLVTVDNYNMLQPCAAESWESNDDATVWTFHLRKGVTWTDMKGNYKADMTSRDWIWGLEWTLNFWKNDSYSTTLPMTYIKGCADYYQYTKDVGEDEAWKLGIDKFSEMVEMETPDDYTIVYHLTQSCTFFDSMATSVFLYPAPEGLLAEVGYKGYKAVNPETLWYNGPYIMQEFIEDSTKTMVPNPNWWNAGNALLFDSVSWIKVESNDVAYQLFEMGEIDTPALSNAQKNIIISDPTHQWHDYLSKNPDSGVGFFMVFNYAKNNVDGTVDETWNLCANNENFRKAFYWGLDLYDWYANRWDQLDPTSVARGTLTVYGLTKLSDGRDYTDLIYDAIDYHPDVNWSRLDPDKFKACKEAAMKELSAQGVTFPVNVDIWCKESGIDYTTIFKECVEDSLGTDFVKVTINQYITSALSEVYNPSYFSIETQGYGALFADPTTFLTQVACDLNGNAEIADFYGHYADIKNPEIKGLFEEFTDMMRKADAIQGDHDGRLKALAEAETFAIEHCIFIPVGTNAQREIMCTNPYSKPAMINDSQSGRYVGWETNSDYYTMEEIEIIRAAYLAVSGKTSMG